MRKGESRFNTDINNVPKAIEFYDSEFVNQWYKFPEIFLPVTDREIPGVRPYYLISNYGRVWHIYEHRFLSTNLDSKGYLIKPFALRNGKQKICRIHRLIMLVFCWIPDNDKLDVNHKDGNKQNCYIGNLEWATRKENTLHAIHVLGEGGKRKVSDEQVHEICKLLEERKLTLNQIAEKTKTSYGIVASIERKAVHTEISDKYNFGRRKIANNLTIDQVNAICKYFESNPKPDNLYFKDYFKEALKSLEIDINTLTVRSVQKIFNKETYKYVSKNYNF